MGLIYSTVVIATVIFHPAFAATFVGDSIALGAGRAAHSPTIARIGASSCTIAQFIPPHLTGTIILSSGVNDGGGCNAAVRKKLASASRVVWIVPPPRYTLARLRIAQQVCLWHDTTIGFVAGRDGLHPKSYINLVKRLTGTLK